MKYALIGEKLSHSYSEIIHHKLGNHDYILKELSRDKLCDFMKKKDFCGINVTIPYKIEVLPYLCSISQEAEKIGSVNTIINKNGFLYGYNTDYFGFSKTAAFAGISFKNKKVLILGTGGTSRTANSVAADEGAKEIITVSRSGRNNYDNLSLHSDSDIIINTTPVGMYPNTEKRLIDLSVFDNPCGVIDVIYNPVKTRLLSDAEKLNIPFACGLPMLVYQALYANNLFFEEKKSLSEADRILSELYFEALNIVLIGMPGCGKTTVGKNIANKLNRRFVDTDDLIVEKSGMTVPEIFEKYGEEYFRKLESEVVFEITRQKGLVIATGGGAAVNEENRISMKQNARVYYIERELSSLSRVGRPLSKSADELQKMYEKRNPIYSSFCDFRIFNNNDADLCADTIINFHKGEN